MKNFSYKNIDINSLYVWKLNPRHEEAENEKEAIKYLFETVGYPYMNRLAQDIIKNGLSPYDLPIIVEIKNTRAKYYAYEGNRRVAVIKSVLNPELVKFDEKLYKKYKLLNEKNANELNKKIYCVLTDHDSAINEIEKIHSGEQGGVGRKKWGNLEKEMFNVAFRDKTSIALNIVNAINEKINKNINSIIKPTNIKRIFSNPKIRETLNTQDYSDLSDIDAEIIYKVIEKAIDITNSSAQGMSRIFNTQDIIERTFVPFIEELINEQSKDTIKIKADNLKMREGDIFDKDSLNINIYDYKNNLLKYDESKLNIRYTTPQGDVISKIDTNIIGEWSVSISYDQVSIIRHINIFAKIIPKLELKKDVINLNLSESYDLMDNISECLDSKGHIVINNVCIYSAGEKQAYIKDNIFLNTNLEGNYQIKYEIKDSGFPPISRILYIVVQNKIDPLHACPPADHILSIANTYNTRINISEAVNILINQLSRLSVNKYNYVIATSLRALIELTVDETIIRKSLTIQYQKNEDKLLSRTKCVINELIKNISNICKKDPSKLSYHTVNNFLKILDVEDMLKYLNLGAHKSLNVITSDKLVEVGNKQVALLLILVHYYLKI
ncbi:hypothetical protein KM799_14030 [Clostridium tyrobutyricum]|uniref:hypothetical protein n=1 Tax=Clostridium tyrobutyricum TaxID=1519 RepID=UPI001C38DC4B|nr:hypothetical protein [Clostridium tyrobutyricum]MBV4447720.1 hypothetical protein [Clostridium tyrobutyricum]